MKLSPRSSHRIASAKPEGSTLLTRSQGDVVSVWGGSSRRGARGSSRGHRGTHGGCSSLVASRVGCHRKMVMQFGSVARAGGYE